MRTCFLLLLTVVLPVSAGGQSSDTSATVPVIQDNSFLIEEAYNQEAGIVQHISTFQARRGSSDFDAAFTQEWPVGSITHQLSYDIPLVRVGGATGLGDVGINYRYQLVGDGNARLAFAPRISVLLPTGEWKQARGAGAPGFEINLPLSYVISPWLTAHSNAGIGTTPSARNQAGERARVNVWSVGQSVILTRSRKIQPMLESVYSRSEEVTGDGSTTSSTSFVISPGARAAFNFSSGLQIVPGIAFPFGLGPNNGERGVLFYLSFEHPFKR